MIASTTRLATAARLRRRRPSASCQSGRPAISSRAAAAGGTAKPGMSIIADFWIKQAIDEIDHEVEPDDERSVEDDDAHDEGVIAVEGALHEIAADARNPENLLDHHRSGDDAGNRRAEIGHHRE